MPYSARFLFTLSLLTSFATHAPAQQGIANIARFGSFTSNNLENPQMMLGGPRGAGATPVFDFASWIEIALPVDERGQPPLLQGVSIIGGGLGLLDVRVTEPGGSSRFFGPYFASQSSQIQYFSSLARGSSIRFSYLPTSFGTVGVEEDGLRVWSAPETRRAEVTQNGIYALPFAFPTRTSATLSFRLDRQDEVGVLFAGINSSLMTSPIYLGLLSWGGLLIDPTASMVAEVRPLIGLGTWNFHMLVNYVPSQFAGMTFHFQAAIIGGTATAGPYVLWTRPLTLHQ